VAPFASACTSCTACTCKTRGQSRSMRCEVECLLKMTPRTHAFESTGSLFCAVSFLWLIRVFPERELALAYLTGRGRSRCVAVHPLRYGVQPYNTVLPYLITARQGRQARPKPCLAALKKPRPKAGPSQSRAPINGFGLAWGLRKPKPAQAKPKPGLPGQAGPEHP
jgi:hypothetical protein